MRGPGDLNALLRTAELHYVGGELADARPLVERVLAAVGRQPGVLNLYGLILSGLGRLAEARAALEAAHHAAPGDPQVANNFGNVLGRLGEHEAALAAYEAAIAGAQDFAPARLNQAITLDALGRFKEARAALASLERIAAPTPDALVASASISRNSGHAREAAGKLEAALAIDPGHAPARRARARVALELGEPDAAERHRRLLAEGAGDRGVVLGYLAAAETMAAREEATGHVARALAADPGWVEGHRALAAARWEDGAPGHTRSFDAALSERPHDPALWAGYVAALGAVDKHRAAADIALRAEAATGDSAFAVAAFAYASAAGELAAAEATLARLPPALVQPLALAKHRLRQRDPGAAEPLLAIATERAPDDVEAWALRGIAWQLLGDDRFHWLNGQPGLVSVETLALDALEIEALAERLRALHANSRQRVGQSLRGGTQTADNLFDREEPEVVLLARAIGDAVERHRCALPRADAAHPLLRYRDCAWGFAGAWSIRLTGGGFHVQHVHPRGIVSAACYWAVPAPGMADPQEGWLEIGGAPAYLALDVEPLHRVQPQVGRLALFPSTLHHGTRPFAAGERMSVAFDVAPCATGAAGVAG